MAAACCTRRSTSALGRRRARKRERHVAVNGLVRIQRVVLEHHRDVPVLRRHVVDQPVADADLAIARLFQPRDHPQNGRLAAARRPHQHDELLVRDVEVDATYRFDGAEPLAEPLQRQLRHARG